MKKIALYMIVMMFCFSAAWAQQKIRVAILSGYAGSVFEEQINAVDAWPLGLQLSYTMTPKLHLGFEVNHLLGGVSWEKDNIRYTRQTSYSQTIHSVFIKFLEGNGKVKVVYKGGAGYFMGDKRITYRSDGHEDTYIYPIESAIGFIVGGGLNWARLLVEFNYNIVSRRIGSRYNTDEEYSYQRQEKRGMNTWSILIGYQIKL